jgi:hypothetical protein
MELFKGIRKKIGKAILSKKLSRIKRIVHYTNIGKVKNIGIVWDASRTSEFAALSKFYQKMHERNIDVKVMGFFPGKELPDQYTAIRYLNCIRIKELSWFYQPMSPETETFINKKLDILIDINFDNLVPLRYISLLSKAGFKIGLFENEKNASTFDLMMDIKKPVEIDAYLNQVIYYLEMINSEKN